MMSINTTAAALGLLLLAAPALAGGALPTQPPEEAVTRSSQGGHVMRPSDKAPVFVTGCRSAEAGCGEDETKP